MAINTVTYQGKPCARCGSDIRYVKGNGCSQCQRNNSKERQNKPEVKARRKELEKKRSEYHKEYRSRPEVIKHRKQYFKDYTREWKYGVTPEDFQQRLATQEHSCAICKHSFPSTAPCVDHNHATGLVRGLLCHQCNKGLGCFSDDTSLLQRAIAYLEN